MASKSLRLRLNVGRNQKLAGLILLILQTKTRGVEAAPPKAPASGSLKAKVPESSRGHA